MKACWCAFCSDSDICGVFCGGPVMFVIQRSLGAVESFRELLVQHCLFCFDQLSFFQALYHLFWPTVCSSTVSCILINCIFFKRCILCFDKLCFFKHCILCFDQLYFFYLQARADTQMGDAKWEKKWWYVFSFSFIFYSHKIKNVFVSFFSLSWRQQS